MHMNMQKKQSGAALVIGLVLLLVLTLLAVSGMNTATLEVQMAGNSQFAENAFQAASAAIILIDRLVMTLTPYPWVAAPGCP